ncbi:MAG: L,D-transpeptidase [Arcobacter sp.]|nr:MAG: L,D-transpeptidase [Arcobacter sp.]
MQIIKYTLTIIIITFFAACTKQIPVEKQVTIEQKKTIVEKTSLDNQFNNVSKYLLSKNEKEFLEILKTDKYASLCSSQDKYLELKNMPNSFEKSEQIKALLLEYTNNLVNSCIDQLSFQTLLKQEKYKKRKQYYEIYNEKIDKDKLLEEFNSGKITVDMILSEYTPTHPDFFKLIEKLDINKLSSENYNKLRLNIERLKLIKEYKNDNFIQLNIPSYNFALYENGEVERKFGTVVGEKDSQTPILSSKLSYFIINPAWNIPDSIAKSTIIPRALKDKNYLKRKNIVIRKNYNLDSKKYRFKDIKWKKYLNKQVKYIPYKFIQLPSRTNGMGRVKFMFPNDYAVYMHDTIGTWRFKSNKEKIRFTSHGCVRLEHPIAFMRHVTKNYTPKTYKSIRKTYLSNEMRTVGLSKKLPLHITYLTSYIKNGKLGFYKDVYEYDKIQKLNFIPYQNAVTFAQANKDSLIKNF